MVIAVSCFCLSHGYFGYQCWTLFRYCNIYFFPSLYLFWKLSRKKLAVWSTAAVASIRCSWSGAVFAETSKWQLRTGWWCSWSSCWRAPRGRCSLTGRGRLWLPWKQETEPAACWTNSELFTNRWVAPSAQLSVDCVPLQFPLLWSSFFFCLISSFFCVCVWALVLV